MAPDDEIEFTEEQGLKVGCVTMLFAAVLIYFGGEQWVELGFIAFGAIASTVFIHRRSLRRPWFLAFVAVMIVAHVALVLALPGTDLDRSGIKVLGFADIMGVIALSLWLKKVMSRRE